jgi:hypothetical protein
MKMNKKLNFLMLFTSIFALTVMTSCSKDDESSNSDDALTGDVLTKDNLNTINAKWEISAPNSIYASFEFHKDGNYIVTERDKNPVSTASVRSSASMSSSESFLFGNSKILGAKKKDVATRESESETNPSPIHFGTYTIEGNTMILSGFGVLEAVSVTTEKFAFALTLEGTEKKEEYVASKVAELIPASTRTDMLCRSWKIQEQTIIEDLVPADEKADYEDEYGVKWKEELQKELDEELLGAIVLFSRAGTYLVLPVGDESEPELAEWKWANEDETAFYYSWENWDEGENWREENIVQINELTGTIFKTVEYGVVETELVPANK